MGEGSPLLRELPRVDDVLARVCGSGAGSALPRGVVRAAVREALEEARRDILGGKRQSAPDAEDGALFRNVVWGRTRAYAAGFGGIYINLEGREGDGVVAPGDEYGTVCKQIAEGLEGLRDPKTGEGPVRRVYFREELYHGPLAAEGPDLVVGCQPGYRVSWETALGDTPPTLFDDNRKLWSGDHIVDPHCVPGVLLANHRAAGALRQQTDIAPTVLGAFSLPLARGTAAVYHRTAE